MELIPENIKKRMTPADRKQYGRAGLTNEEHEANAGIKLEKELHNQYIGFLRRNELEYIHAPMHKKSELPEGHPDFTVFGPGAKTLFIEFKILGNVLSDIQAQRISKLRGRGFDTLVLYSYANAISATLEFFQL